MARKLDKSEVISRINSVHDGKIKVIGDFSNTSEKTEFKCNVCGDTWSTTIHSVLCGSGCPKCSGRKRLTKDDVESKIKEIHNGTIEPISDYKGGASKMKFHCNVCGTEWETTANSVMMGHGCPTCASKRRANFSRMSKQEVQSRIKDVSNGTIELIGDYINSHSITQFRCLKCGNVWETSVSPILDGHGCPKCYHNSIRRDESEVIKSIQDCTDGKISMIGKLDTVGKKTTFRCNVCGFEWESTPINILRGRGCPKCFGKFRTEEEVQDLIDKKHNGTIKMIGDYTNVSSPTTFKCTKCGNEWEAIPSSLIYRYGCPRCACSKGEDRISYWLDNNWSKDDWESQKKFKDLKGVGGGYLSYDFYIPSKNLCIEFQGGQHFKPIKHFGGEKRFSNQQEHDRRKRQYCIDNNICLLEIPYEDLDKIEDILDRELKI